MSTPFIADGPPPHASTSVSPLEDFWFTHGSAQQFPRHYCLSRHSDRYPALMLLRQGSVREYLHSTGTSGRELTLRIAGPGAVLGLSGLAGVGLGGVNAVALTPVRCLVLSGKRCQELMHEQPALAQSLLQASAAQLAHLMQTLGHVMFSDAYTRLRYWLQHQQQCHSMAGAGQAVPTTHQHIAQQIGCSREMVTRMLQELVRGGYVERDQHKIYRVHRRLPLRW